MVIVPCCSKQGLQQTREFCATLACAEQDTVKATGFGFKSGENGPLERGFWLEMMDKSYHKLLSSPWAAAEVIYELVYGHRHAVVIARSSLQYNAGCSWQ